MKLTDEFQQIKDPRLKQQLGEFLVDAELRRRAHNRAAIRDGLFAIFVQ